MFYRDQRGRVLAHPPADPADVEIPSLVIPPGLILPSYEAILISISGGADSWFAAAMTVQAAQEAGVLDRVRTVFADLGGDDEWPGTRELAAEHAASFGLRHDVVYRQVPDQNGTPRQEGLLKYIGGRHQQMWPLPQQPYCRSAMKIAPIKVLKTRIAEEHRRRGITGRPVRILEVLGLRAQESPSRRKQSVFSHRAGDSNSRRHVDLWLPIHEVSEQQRWACIDKAGARWHWIYYFLPRLSCRFCILAPREQLIAAARLDPAGARRRAELSDRMGHAFQHSSSLWDVIAEAEARGPINTTMLTRWQRHELQILRRAA